MKKFILSVLTSTAMISAAVAAEVKPKGVYECQKTCSAEACGKNTAFAEECIAGCQGRITKRLVANCKKAYDEVMRTRPIMRILPVPSKEAFKRAEAKVTPAATEVIDEAKDKAATDLAVTIQAAQQAVTAQGEITKERAEEDAKIAEEKAAASMANAIQAETARAKELSEQAAAELTARRAAITEKRAELSRAECLVAQADQTMIQKIDASKLIEYSSSLNKALWIRPLLASNQITVTNDDLKVLNDDAKLDELRENCKDLPALTIPADLKPDLSREERAAIYYTVSADIQKRIKRCNEVAGHCTDADNATDAVCVAYNDKGKAICATREEQANQIAAESDRYLENGEGELIPELAKGLKR